jgi:hypothetical protein
MSDDRDFLEKAQSFAVKHTGREMTPDEYANEFSKWDVDKRASYLDEAERDLSTHMTMREAGRIRRFLGPLQRRHRELVAINR